MRAKLTSFLSILCLLMVFAAVVQAAPAGKVTNLEGRADLTAPGQPAKALLIGDAVNVGDILRTKSASKLEVTWIDGSIARLSENSRLKVTEFTMGAKKRSTILSLFRGKAQNIVTGATQLFGAKDGSRYEVHTPTSVCGVRGTTFFTYHENGISGALFTEGKGFMYSKGQPGNVKPVAPGILMIVTSANKPPEARPAKPGDATNLFNATNPSEKKKDDKKGEEKKEGATGGGTSGTGGTTTTSGKDESTGGTKTEDTGGTAGTTGTTGTTGAGDTGSGTTGTGGTTTMLGGDPTATLGTAPPGTLASQIESGTTADTPGTTGTPITNPTTPVTPVVVPVVVPTETTTTFTQSVAQGTIDGTLTGSISDRTNTGTLNLAGTGMESIYVVPTTGSLSDGSTDNSYLAGIPGSWRGLFIGLSRKGTSVSLLSGTFPSGAYTDQTLNAAGSIARAIGYGISAESQYQSFTNLPLVVLQNISFGQALSGPVIYGPISGDITTDGIMGYTTSAGGILGIWGAQTLNGAYINATGETSKTINLYHYNYYPEYQYPSDHFAFGSATITDDLQGHTTVKSSALTYLDRYYLGTLSLDYQGVYVFSPETSPTAGVNYPYSSIGTGVYNLQPLSWSGDWGSNRYYDSPESLYANFYDEEYRESVMVPVAHDMGLAGGVTPFWSQTSRMTALGYLVDDSGATVMGETVAGPLLWNSGIGAQSLSGAIAEDILTPDAEFTGSTAGIWKGGLMKGSAYAIYKTAAGQAGWLIGKDTISGLYDSEIGMWKAEGDLTPTQKIAQLPEGVTSADLEVFHDIAIGWLGGSFTGNQGIINSYSDIMQTTFYGKQISVYDEESEGYVDKILPLRWGIYDLRMDYGNSFSGKPAGATAWTSKIGGYGPTQMNAPFFYLADISGNWLEDGTINAQLSGTYMTPLYLGVLSGPFYGIYNIEGTDDLGQYGGWIGQSIGTYNVTQKLAHSATWGKGGLFTDAGGWLDRTGYIMGLLGGTTAPWSGSSAFKAMGLFQLAVELGLERGTYLWNGAIQGSVPQELSETPSAGGIYSGYSAALWRTDSYAGAIRTIYLTPPDATTGKSTAGFLTGDSIAGTIYNLVQDRQEYDDGYVETYTVGLWEDTGTNTLTASAPVASGLDPEAVTLAGGLMTAKLSGAFGGNGALTNDTARGDFTFFMNGATPLLFGVYDLKLGSGDPGGIFSGKPAGATAWAAKIGGAFNDEPAYEYGYWLADVGGQWNAAGEITGNVSNGTYLTPTQMGTLSGPFYGLYTEQGTGESGTYGTWVGQSVGNYEGKNLAFVSDLLPSLRYYNGSDWPYDSISVYGLLGGTDSLWGSSASSPVTISALGQWSLSSSPGSTSHIFNTVTYSHNYKDASMTTYDGGSYYLLYGGRELNGQMDANIAGLYIKDGKAGFLIGSIAGSIYQDIGMWNAEGSMYKEEKIDTNVPAESLNSNIWYGSLYGNMSAYPNDLNGSIGYSAVRTLYDNVGTTWMKGGIWSFDLGGTHGGTIVTPWTAVVGGQGDFAPYYNGAFIVDPGYWLADISNGAWDGNKIGADISGAYLTRHQMGTMNGNLLGTYNNTTWQAAGIGTYDNGQELAYNGAFVENNGGFGYWDFVNKKFIIEDSITSLPLAKIAGLVGGVGELFNGQGNGGANLPVDLTGIGEYEAAKVGTYALFGSEIAGNNDLVASATNNYLLTFGGVRKADDAGGSLLGKGLGLYYRQTAADVYEVGLLSSNLIQANLYPAIGDPVNPGMWEIPEDAVTTLLASAKNTIEGSADPPILNPVHEDLRRPGAIGTAEQKLGDISLESAGYLNQNWGILYGGFGLDQGALPVGSTALAGGTMLYEGGDAPVTIGYWIGNISNIKTLDSYTTGTYAGETIFFDAQNRVFQKGVVNTDPSALGANLVAVNDGSKQVGMTLADYATTPMAFGSMINGSVQRIVNGTFYAREYEKPYDFEGYFRPLGYEYRYFPYPSATANATNGMAFEVIEKQMAGYHGTYDERYHYLYTGNYVGTTSINYINHLFAGGLTSALTPVPNFTGDSPDSPHFDSSLIVDGETWFTSDKYVKTLTSQWDNVNALVRNVPFQGILGGLPGENLWSATGSDPAQIKLIGTVDPSAQYMTFSGNIAGTTGSVSEVPTNAYFASIGGSLLDSAGGITPLSGAVIGLFINQDNPSAPKAGFLHGSFSGDAYAGIGMWDGAGGLWVEEKAITGALPEAGAAGLLTPEHPSLFTGVLGVDVNDNLAGSFLDDQNASSGLIQSQIVTLGSTYSIAGQTDWGIFTMTHAMNNTYSNPGGKTAWTSDFAGVAEFGGYLSHNTYWTYRDAGYWKAAITDGTWANGWIGGDVTGEFLTHKKYGTLTGQLQGVYTADTVGGTTGTWQDVIGGTWQKAGDVYFSSAVYGRAYTLRHSQQGWDVYDKGNGINNYYSFYYEDDHAIWPDQYADATYTNNVNQTKTTYRFEMYGMPTAPVYRKNTWTQNMSDGTYTFAQTVYETRDEYLAAMADLATGPEGAVTPHGYYVLGDNSGFYGLMAGVGNLWDNLGSTTPYSTAATPLRFAGDINQFDTAERGFSLFAAQVVSFDPLTTLDPFMNSRTPVWNGKSGAYLANLGGIVDNQQNLSGSLQGLYLDDGGNVGIFYGNLTGRHDTALSMWEAEGSAYTYLMNTSSEITGLGLTPENFAAALNAGALNIETNMNSIEDPGLAGEDVIGAEGSAIHLSSLQSTKIKLPSVYGSFDPNWRVEQTLLGGTYAGKPSSWTWTFNSPTVGRQPLQEDTDWASVQITSSDTTNAFTGQMAGAKVKWAEGATNVSGAEIKGLFDPVATTWKAVAQGAEMETGAFLAKVSSLDDAGKAAFMNATKIPAVLAGQATLSQASGTTVNNLSNVTMNNVGFYAYSTGVAPKIWATNNVGGNYSGAPSTSGATVNNVPLSGNGLNATFNVNQWNGSTWGANVAGSGTLSGVNYNGPVQFTGGAAGAIQPATGSTGSFSGTAAGIAK